MNSLTHFHDTTFDILKQMWSSRCEYMVVPTGTYIESTKEFVDFLDGKNEICGLFDTKQKNCSDMRQQTSDANLIVEYTSAISASSGLYIFYAEKIRLVDEKRSDAVKNVQETMHEQLWLNLACDEITGKYLDDGNKPRQTTDVTVLPSGKEVVVHTFSFAVKVPVKVIKNTTRKVFLIN